MQYVLLGADEGLFSLLVTNNPDPVMEQVSYMYTNNVHMYMSVYTCASCELQCYRRSMLYVILQNVYVHTHVYEVLCVL